MNRLNLIEAAVIAALVWRVLVLHFRYVRPPRDAWNSAERRKITGDESVLEGTYVETRCITRGDPGYYQTRIYRGGSVIEDHFHRTISEAMKHHDRLVKQYKVKQVSA